MHYTYIKPNPNTPFLLPYMFWPRTPPPILNLTFHFSSPTYTHTFLLSLPTTSSFCFSLLLKSLLKPSWICTSWVFFVPLSFPANSLLFRQARAANGGERRPVVKNEGGSCSFVFSLSWTPFQVDFSFFFSLGWWFSFSSPSGRIPAWWSTANGD